MEENLDAPPGDASASANLDSRDRGYAHADEQLRLAHHQWRFLNAIGYMTIVFLVLVFSVFREVAHSRELFHMNQLMLAADAQRRHWQEVARLEEAQDARLMAELFRQSLRQDAPDRNTTDNLAALQP